MAERRMFAKTIIDSDAFLDMPVTARLLYYDLAMRADDDGFVNSPKKIMRMIGSSDDDLRILAARKFIIPFDSGVVVIKHWKIHNYIRKDAYQHTTYTDEFAMLETDEKNAYTLPKNSSLQVRDEFVDSSATQVRIGKDSIDQNNNTSTSVLVRSTSVEDATPLEQVRKAWNELSDVGINAIRTITEGSTRAKMLRARIKQYGIDSVIEAIGMIRQSSFLLGNSKRGWSITFDWFIKPNNFPKVLEGNYSDKNHSIGNPTGTVAKNIKAAETIMTDEDWESGGDNV